MSAEKNKKAKKNSVKEKERPSKQTAENCVPAHFYFSGDISLGGRKNAANSDKSLRSKPKKGTMHINGLNETLDGRKDVLHTDAKEQKKIAACADSDLRRSGDSERRPEQNYGDAAIIKSPYTAEKSRFSAENNALLASLKAEDIKCLPDSGKNENSKVFLTNAARHIIMAAFVAVMIVSAVNIVLDVYSKSKAASLYDDIREMFYSDEVLYLNPGYLSRDAGSVPEERLYSDEGDIYRAPELEVLDMHEKYERMLPNLEALKQINSSAFAWIKVEGTRVDYPVVRSPEGDNDYYLSHAIDRTYSDSGSVFTDCNNSTNLSNNRNTCVYGHNMNDGTMFQTIMNFRTRNQFLNGRIELYTVNGIYLYTPFSVYDAAPTESFFKTSFADDAEFDEFLKDIKSKSMFSSGASVGTGDKVVTLITCTNTVTDKRFVVHGVLTEIAK